MNRSTGLSRLNEPFDILVIGGGATGLGVALDASTRGYRVLLAEARDFAQGTSSRSTKLVHGGVRYLQQGNVSLVREALRERGLLLRNAPHLVEELRFLVPAYHRWELPFYGTGLWLYDVLAGSLKMSSTDLVGPEAAARLVPTIERHGLRGGVLYSDAQFNDARLAISIARTAADAGAVLLNYAPVVSLVKREGRLTGAVVADTLGGREHEVRARVVVNATGVFTDAIRRLDDPDARDIIAVSQGIHLVLGGDFLPGQTAVMVPHTDDGRVVFIIPWQGRTLMGTTDTPLPSPSTEPAPLESEVDFVLRHAGRYLAQEPTRRDVLAAFAGLRPLVKGNGASTSALSRDHTLLVSPSGLVTVTGGKWTTYRQMAEDAIDAAARTGALPRVPCKTKSLRLVGATSAERPWQEFGATAAEVADYRSRFPGLLHPSLPYELAMVAYAVEREMAVRLEDVLSRRLRALVLDAKAVAAAATTAAQLMARLQGHDENWVEGEVAAFNRLAQTCLPPT